MPNIPNCPKCKKQMECPPCEGRRIRSNLSTAKSFRDKGGDVTMTEGGGFSTKGKPWTAQGTPEEIAGEVMGWVHTTGLTGKQRRYKVQITRV